MVAYTARLFRVKLSSERFTPAQLGNVRDKLKGQLQNACTGVIRCDACSEQGRCARQKRNRKDDVCDNILTGR